MLSLLFIVIFLLSFIITLLFLILMLHVVTFVVYHCCSFHDILATNNLHIVGEGGNKMNNKLVHVCICFHCSHVYDSLRLNNNNDQNWKKINYLIFSIFFPLTKFGSMESIHVEGSFDIFMNEVKLHWRRKLKKKGLKDLRHYHVHN